MFATANGNPIKATQYLRLDANAMLAIRQAAFVEAQSHDQGGEFGSAGWAQSGDPSPVTWARAYRNLADAADRLHAMMVRKARAGGP